MLKTNTNRYVQYFNIDTEQTPDSSTGAGVRRNDRYCSRSHVIPITSLSFPFPSIFMTDVIPISNFPIAVSLKRHDWSAVCQKESKFHSLNEWITIIIHECIFPVWQATTRGFSATVICALCVLFYCHLTCLYYVVFHEQINGWMDGWMVQILINYITAI